VFTSLEGRYVADLAVDSDQARYFAIAVKAESN
jgi:hypothetical protein